MKLLVGLIGLSLVVSVLADRELDATSELAALPSKAGPEAAAAALVNRVCPGHAGHFICEIIPADRGRDVFEIENVKGKIHLRGNNSLAMAMALNWYLRYTVNTNFDWLAVKPLTLPDKLPLPAAKVRQSCAARERFFLNYCTYGYTMPWWDAGQWERFIDWMAMNGINRPLMQAGLEATWLEVWKSYGLSEDAICEYFGGPAHLPWHRMANHDKWGGPLPMSYIQGQQKLQVKILARARELGMKPILSGFAGHVPEALKAVKPDAKYIRIAPGWGGMDQPYSTWFLAPDDPLFAEVQCRFLKAQAAMYGGDHLYGADPFNEMSPPSWEPEFLANVARSIYGSMAAADPDSVWYQMSWTFYFDKNWTAPRLSAMTKAVPLGKLVYLDYVCEETEFFRKSEHFHGAPFIWCYLANFGGNTHLIAPIHKLSTRLAAALPENGCAGVGSTLEGINVNPIAYDLLLEQPWHVDGTVDLGAWVQAYADRRAGVVDPAVRDAWKMLAEKVLLDNGSGIWGHGIALQSRPNPDQAGGWANHSIPYQRADLVAALDRMMQATTAATKADGYQFDVVNLTRQALGNHTAVVRERMMAAFKAHDKEAFRREAKELLDLGRDVDSVVGTRHEFLLGSWIESARKWGATADEMDRYEENARQIISTWHKANSSLTDYSNRQWNGMISSYYLVRWEEFIRRAEASLENQTPWDQKAYDQWRADFEGQWSKRHGDHFPAKATGDAVETARRIFSKWRERLKS